MVEKRIKLYGERNTGTRYLTRLFEHNLRGEVIPGVAPRWTTWVQALVPGKEIVRDAWFARKFTDDEISMVNTRLDRELMAGLGYRVLE